MSGVDVAGNKATVRRVFDEVINEQRLDVIDEIYDEHIVDHDPLPGAPPGIEGVKYSIGGLIASFPDLHVTIEDMSAHGDFVTVHNVWTGTQTGKLVGLPSTGRTVTFTGVVIWRLREGKIAERWAIINLIEQMGVARKRRRRRASMQALNYEDAVTPSVTLQPIAPEKYDAWMAFHDELKGPRRDEFAASRRRLGVKREMQWLMVWPQVGDLRFEVGLYEVEDIARFGYGLATSTDPFDVWYREQIAYFHDFDWSNIAELGPASKLMFEWSED